MGWNIALSSLTIWSIGATCDRASTAKFSTLLRQLLAGKVTAAAERSDFDLGPGLAISYHEQLLSTQLPEVGSEALASCGPATGCNSIDEQPRRGPANCGSHAALHAQIW